MKNLPSKTLTNLLGMGILALTTSCQLQAGLFLTPTAEATPIPSPLSQEMVESSAFENMINPFPYAEVDQFDEIDFGGLSGIVFHPQRQTLWAAGDEGYLTELRTDGTLVQQKQVRPNADFEGITYRPDTGMLYVAVEGNEIILEVNPEILEIAREIPINRLFEGRVLLDPEGNGIEDITFVPASPDLAGGALYLVNQSKGGKENEPSIIFAVEVDGSVDRPTAKISKYFTLGITDLAGMYYDPASQQLLVISDDNNLLLAVSLSGQILNMYHLPGGHQEGITIDGEGFLYLAQDSKKGILKFKPDEP